MACPVLRRDILGAGCTPAEDRSVLLTSLATLRTTRWGPAFAAPPNLPLHPLQKYPQRNLQSLCNRQELQQIQIRITRLDLNDGGFGHPATLREIRARLLETHSSHTHGSTQCVHERC